MNIMNEQQATKLLFKFEINIKSNQCWEFQIVMFQMKGAEKYHNSPKAYHNTPIDKHQRISKTKKKKRNMRMMTKWNAFAKKRKQK